MQRKLDMRIHLHLLETEELHMVEMEEPLHRLGILLTETTQQESVAVAAAEAVECQSPWMESINLLREQEETDIKALFM